MHRVNQRTEMIIIFAATALVANNITSVNPTVTQSVYAQPTPSTGTEQILGIDELLIVSEAKIASLVDRLLIAAPVAISGDNVYVAWHDNQTGVNNEVIFRASTDGGLTFGDKINLSNTTDSDSTRVEIDSDEDSVVVTWWETNQTDDVPVMRVSNDNGATFGPVLGLAINGTISSSE